MNHTELKQAVMDALGKLFEDCSVSSSEMRDTLTSIKEEIDSMAESLEPEVYP